MIQTKGLKIVISVFLLFISSAAMAGVISDSLKLAIEETHEIDKKTALLFQLGFSLKEINPDTAIIVVKEALRLSKNTNLLHQTAISHNLLGELFLKTDQMNNAVEEFKVAETLLLELDDKSSLLTSYLALGNIYIQRDNLPEAMESYNKAIVLAEQLADSVRLSSLYNNLGILNLYLHNNEKALELYSRAFQLFKNLGDTINIAGTTTNIGTIYVNLDNFEIAKNYYLQGLELFQSINMVEGEAHALLKLGILELKRKHFKEALDYLNRSIDKLSEVGITYSGVKSIFLAETLINKGIVLTKMLNYDEALEYLDKGMDIAIDGGDIGLMSQAANYISQYYSEKMDFKKALEYYKIFKLNSDSISNESSIRKLAQLEMQLEYDENLYLKTLENQELIQKQQRNTLYSILFVSILILGLTLLLVLFKLEKNKKKKAELAQLNLEEKLEHTNKELTTHVMYLLQKNEFILSISEKLKLAKLEAKAENKQRISELISELESNSEMFSWEEFEIRFQQVYTNFYKTLYERFPNLSQNEIRLCAFAKLNMTTKEIAAITFQSTNSISVARYRLRKKLGLNQEDNLHAFFAEM